MTKTTPKLHRDGTVTYWSVYRQVWVRRASAIPADELAAMDYMERSRVGGHLGMFTLEIIPAKSEAAS